MTQHILEGIGTSESFPITRRRALTVVATATCLTGCGSRGRDNSLADRIDRAIAAAIRAMIAAQSADGAWRSGTYGALKDGLSLTPTVLKAVVFGPPVAGAEQARLRGAAYIVAQVRADGSIDGGPFGLVYPVYSAAAAVIVLGRVAVARAARAREGWLQELRRRQLTEELGWNPADPAYGGWGYSVEPPFKVDSPSAAPPDADLSSTLFALGALRIAGVTADDPAVRKAQAFVERCQNFAKNDGSGDPALDDGGFFFTPTDPARNKAGEAENGSPGRARYHSYGSATADGLRALVRCGLSSDHPRVVAARRWLERNFSAVKNPGTFAPVREAERDSTYYYYAWSLAHAFRALGVGTISVGGRPIAWGEELARELLGRQRADGFWTNRFRASKEDDPLIATPLAAGALGSIRMMGSGQPGARGEGG